MSHPPASFAEEYLNASFTCPIAYGEVKAVALEGGGGKGNAYVGAICALEQLKMLENLEAVAGSSAGAITALALSLGMRTADVFEFMKSTKFAEFFDQESSAIPVPGRSYEKPPATALAMRSGVVESWRQVVFTTPYFGQAIQGLKRVLKGAGRAITSAVLKGLYYVEDLTRALDLLQRGPFGPAGPGVATGFPSSSGDRSATIPEEQESLTDRVVDQLLASLPEYLTSLSLDMGLFSGEVARDQLAKLIADRFAGFEDAARGQSVPGTKVDGKAVTFEQLDKFCKSHKFPLLRVACAELCSLKTVIFSGSTTGKFPVADAVRMSMGLPFVYKPYTLRSTGKDLPPCGVYVDGGVFSNLPLLAFSDEEAKKAIGLRLEIDTSKRIDGFLTFLAQVGKASLLAGESSVTADRARRTVRLDTDPLGLFDFSADAETLERVAARAHLTTMLFFNQRDHYVPINVQTGEVVPPALAHNAEQAAWDDLQASIERRRKASGCVFKD